MFHALHILTTAYRRVLVAGAVGRRPAQTFEDTKMSNTLTEQEVATALRISTKTLQRWRASGVGPVYLKVAGRVRYPQAELVSYLAERVELPEAA